MLTADHHIEIDDVNVITTRTPPRSRVLKLRNLMFYDIISLYSKGKMLMSHCFVFEVNDLWEGEAPAEPRLRK